MTFTQTFDSSDQKRATYLLGTTADLDSINIDIHNTWELELVVNGLVNDTIHLYLSTKDEPSPNLDDWALFSQSGLEPLSPLSLTAGSGLKKIDTKGFTFARFIREGVVDGDVVFQVSKLTSF